MLSSRAISTLRIFKGLQRTSTKTNQIQRNGHSWNYRVPPPPPTKNFLLAADIVQGVAWWWVLWHLWTEPGHVFGEWEYPDASLWTDEELGIPPS